MQYTGRTLYVISTETGRKALAKGEVGKAWLAPPCHPFDKEFWAVPCCVLRCRREGPGILIVLQWQNACKQNSGQICIWRKISKTRRNGKEGKFMNRWDSVNMSCRSRGLHQEGRPVWSEARGWQPPGCPTGLSRGSGTYCQGPYSHPSVVSARVAPGQGPGDRKVRGWLVSPSVQKLTRYCNDSMNPS